MCSYHIIHVKDDRFIGHGLNLSWKGKRPPPSTFSGRQDLHTSLKSQGHTADRRSGGQASAGGTEAAHSLPPPPTTVQGKLPLNRRVKPVKCPKEAGSLARCHRAIIAKVGRTWNSDPRRGKASDGRLQKKQQNCASRRCILWIRANTRAQNFISDDLEAITWSKAEIRGLQVLKSEAGALLPSRATSRQLRRADGGGERAIFTPRMMEQLWETTPGPWWLITADTGWWVGGDTSSPAASPSAAAAAAAASTAGPLPASSSSASWQKPPRHDSSNTTATEPLDGGSTDASQKAAGIQAYRAVVIQLSCPPVCLSLPSGWDWSFYITSYLPPRQHPATADGRLRYWCCWWWWWCWCWWVYGSTLL